MNKWKVILGGTTGTIGITGAVAVPLIHKSFSEPWAKTLDSSANYADTSEFGGHNKKFLVLNTQENKEWWDWSYNTRFKPYKEKNPGKITSTSYFSKATKSFATENSDSLSALCGNLYNKKLGSALAGAVFSGSELNEDLKGQIKLFCAVGGTENLNFSGN